MPQRKKASIARISRFQNKYNLGKRIEYVTKNLEVQDIIRQQRNNYWKAVKSGNKKQAKYYGKNLKYFNKLLSNINRSSGYSTHRQLGYIHWGRHLGRG